MTSASPLSAPRPATVTAPRPRARSRLVLLPYAAILALGAATGLPRLPSLLFPGPAAGGTPYHAWIAAAAWTGTLAVLLREIGRALRSRISAHAGAATSGIESFLRVLWRQLRRNRLAVAGLHGALLLVLVTLLTPLLASYDPARIDAGPHLAPPSASYPLGTDEFGRDLASRLLYGSRISLSIGFLAVTISATLGALWGAVSGSAGGRIDSLMMWTVDLALSIPRLVLVITVVGLFRPRGAAALYVVILVLGLTGWMGVARIVRGLVLSLREQDFILATRALGQSEIVIVIRHLLPNALAPVIVHATLGIGATILTEAALSFLGLGVPPPIATWGSTVADGREFIRSAWWIATMPGLLIVYAVMSFNLLGDGLRDALDPKLRHR